MIHPPISIAAGTDFSFSGFGDGPAGCEALIRTVRLRAFQDGQLRNREWMAGYASTLFAGEALQWHARLSEDVQLDWRALEQALMDRYIPPLPVFSAGQVVRPTLLSQPTQLSLPPAYDQLSVQSRHRPGSIRVLPTTPGSSRSGGWIARAVDSGRCHTITSVLDDSLRVQCTSASHSELQQLKIVWTPALLNAPDEWLGIRWYDRELKLPTSDHFAYLFRLNGPESIDAGQTMCRGPTRSTVWQVEANGTLTPCWVDDASVRHMLEVVFNNTSKRLAIIGDYNAFTGFNRAGYTKVRLVLELFAES